MINREKIEAAAAAIASLIQRTPVMQSSHLDAMIGARLFFKCENFQKTGSFKSRGACYSAISLSASDPRSLVGHSMGNHGAGLAYAGSKLGIPVTIVVPHDAPAIKVDAIRAYGAEVITCEPTLQARTNECMRIQEDTGAIYISPFENEKVITGQGSVAVEMLEQIPQMDAVLVPVGGGGLISGVGTMIKSFDPSIEVIGVEPESASVGTECFRRKKYLGDFSQSYTSVAEGLAAPIGELNHEIIMKHVDDFITVSESSIVEVMKYLWTRMKLVVEASAAVGLAALMCQKDRFQGKRVATILTGGNVDIENLPWTK